MVVKGGRKRAYKTKQAYRTHIREVTASQRGFDALGRPIPGDTAHDPFRSVYYGSKCFKR